MSTSASPPNAGLGSSVAGPDQAQAPVEKGRWYAVVWPWFAAAASGVLLALGYPPFNTGWLAWVALIPLMAAIWLNPGGATRWRWLRNFGLGYTAGLFFFQLAFSWLSTVTLGGCIALNCYLALYFGVWGWFAGLLAGSEHRWVRSRSNLLLALLAAAGWVGQEYLRNIVFTGFGWNGLGVALWRNTAMIQFADLTGVRGISFLVAFANVIALATVIRFAREVRVMRIRPHFDFTCTMAMIGAVFVYGVFALRKDPPPLAIRFATVQANIPQTLKWDPSSATGILSAYERLTLQAIETKPQLLVWPEAATPGALAYDFQSRDLVLKLSEKGDFEFLLGTLDGELVGGVEKDFNAAFLLSNQGKEVQRYWKIHLVPFGEFIPFRDSFPLFKWIAGSQLPSDFSSGGEATVFELRRIGAQVAPLICFEDTLSYLPRKFVQRGAELLVNITNDGWFLQSQGSMQHLANAVFRTIENRRPMLRAANSGVTCVVTEKGVVSQMLADESGNTFIEGVMSGEIRVPIQPPLTFFTQYGEWFSWLSLAVAAIGGAALALVRKRRAAP